MRTVREVSKSRRMTQTPEPGPVPIPTNPPFMHSRLRAGNHTVYNTTLQRSLPQLCVNKHPMQPVIRANPQVGSPLPKHAATHEAHAAPSQLLRQARPSFHHERYPALRHHRCGLCLPQTSKFGRSMDAYNRLSSHDNTPLLRNMPFPLAAMLTAAAPKQARPSPHYKRHTGLLSINFAIVVGMTIKHIGR